MTINNDVLCLLAGRCQHVGPAWQVLWYGHSGFGDHQLQSTAHHFPCRLVYQWSGIPAALASCRSIGNHPTHSSR